MGFATKDNLNWSRWIIEDARHPFHVVKEEHRSLVCRKAACKAYGKGIFIKDMVGAVYTLCTFAVTQILLAYTPTNQIDHFDLTLMVGRPKFVIRYRIDRIP